VEGKPLIYKKKVAQKSINYYLQKQGLGKKQECMPDHTNFGLHWAE